MNPSAKRYRGVGASSTAYIMTVGVLLAVLGARAAAQESSDPAQKQTPVPAAADKSVKSAPAESAAKPRGEGVRENPTGTLAIVTSEVCHVRCFASNLSRFYDGPLPKGTVVEVGEEIGEYRRVILPLGVLGYVSKRYTDPPVDGIIKSNTKLVSFRSRPTPKNRAEAPVQTVPQGTEFRYVGEIDTWWKVRFVTASAYVPIKEISVVDKADATAISAYQELASAHDAEWRDAVSKFETKAKIVSEQAARAKALEDLRIAFHGEAKKKLSDQTLAPIQKELADLIAKLPEEAPLMVHARYLESAIERQQVFVDADRVLNGPQPVPPPAKVIVAPTPEDRLAKKLHVIGWLRHYPNEAGPAKFRLEKGGRVVSFLFSTDMRYELGLFDGVEIGVRGVRRRDAAVPYLEVQAIEILGQGR